MRVIGGQARRRRLKVPKGRDLRPTADRVKEALFNILPRDLSGCRVLDLFAGTGNLALEALSRGAAEALLVDQSHSAVKVMRANLAALGFAERGKVWNRPALRAVHALAREREKFDLIFLDPPYDRSLVEPVLRAIAQGSLLSAAGQVVAEHSVREGLSVSYGGLARRDQRRYGSTVLSFFINAASPEIGDADGEKYGSDACRHLSGIL